MTQCVTCGVIYESETEHLCYHQQLSIKEKKKLSTLQAKDPTVTDLVSSRIPVIYYDYEAVRGPDGEQRPSMAVAWDAEDPDQPCCTEFSNDAFLKWVFHPRHKGVTFIAHNAAKYDISFVKHYMLNHQIPSSDIRVGNAYISVVVTSEALKGLRFIDSYRFLSMSLASFSKTFNLPISKGFFPYDFYTVENQYYIGPPPARSYFTKQAQADSRFEKFYAGLNDPYDIQAECAKYCAEDVALLRAGCEIYRKAHWDNTGLDLFASVTGPGACKAVFNRRYMKPDSIALFTGGLNTEDAYEWLDFRCWLAENPDPFTSEAEEMQRVLFDNGQEFELDKTPLVLTLNEDPRILATDQFGRSYIYRFCFDTGCYSCFKNQFTMNPFRNKTLGTLGKEYRTWRSTLNSLKVVEISHHAWIRDRKRSQGPLVGARLLRVVMFFDERNEPPRITPLQYRDALRGGRTEVFKKQIPQGATASYVDFTSLYPSIQFGEFCEALPRKRSSTKN